MIAKRLVLYRIENEQQLSDFETAIQGIDDNCEPIIPKHAIAFSSDKPIEKIDEILNKSGGIKSHKDEFYVLTLGQAFCGVGPLYDDIRKFLLK